MSEPSDGPDITLVEQWLSDADGAMEASEAHGLLCGLLCARGTGERRHWLEQVVGEEHLGNAGLNALFDVTVSLLNDPELGFRLLLPADSQPLSERAVALRRWTHGFLYGIGMGGVNQETLSEEVYDFLRDLLEVAKVDFDTDHATEADETAFFEIQEFVRLGALTVYEELNPAPAATTGSIH
ncbi:UPF0149 family protein [Endothiovibrio diazotrophicus]